VRRLTWRTLSLGLAAATLLATARPAAAQFRTSGLTGNNSLGGGLGGTSSFGAGGGLSSGLSSGLGSGLGGSSFGSLGSGGFGSSMGGNLGSAGFNSNSFGFTNTGGTGSRSGASTGSFRPGASQSYGSTSFLGQYYGNPLSLGLITGNGNTSPQMTFGQQLFNVNTGAGAGAYGNYGGVSPLTGRTGTTTGVGAVGAVGALGGGALGGANRVGALGAAGGALGGTAAVNSGLAGANNGAPAGVGVTRTAPAYVATIGFSTTPLSPSRLAVDLQDTIARSSQLPSRGNIQVSMDGSAVILRGEVADESERRLAEGMMRLTPGVHEVQNELTVRNPGGP